MGTDGGRIHTAPNRSSIAESTNLRRHPSGAPLYRLFTSGPDRPSHVLVTRKAEAAVIGLADGGRNHSFLFVLTMVNYGTRAQQARVSGSARESRWACGVGVEHTRNVDAEPY